MRIGLLSIIFWFFILDAFTVRSQSAVNKSGWKTLKIQNESVINSAGMESSPAFIGDKIGFVTAPATDKKDGLKEPFYDLVWAQVQLDNSLSDVMPINSRINSELHEGPMCYDALTNTLYFTRSHKEKRERKGLTVDTSYLRILSADLNLSKPKIAPININVDNYSVCHPTLTKDGESMIFSSNRRGRNGGMDLYISHLEGDIWSDPLNLGALINTEYHEVFPYLWKDTILLFASDRPDGWGGLDIYVSMKRDQVWQTPELLGSPINSPFDDLGMIVRDNALSGYFTSNRPGGQGKDDIYSFQSKAPIFGAFANDTYEARVELLDKLSFEPIQNAKLEVSMIDMDINDFILSAFNVDVLSGRDPEDIFLKLTPQNKTASQQSQTDSLGKTKFEIKRTKKYLLTITAQEYNTLNILYDYDLIGSDFNLVLEPLGNESWEEKEATADYSMDESSKIVLPIEKGSVIVFENIYYAYNSSQILDDASSELDILVKVMYDYPDRNIRIESHTDSRGTHAYNLQLSIKRAEAVRQYLIKQGIDEDRMTIKGYGESRLRNICADGVKCTEEEHKYNRRTEIVVE